MSISFDCVSFAYGDTPICQELTWHLPATGVVCLWGPSGCGKTTLLRLLAGLEKPTQGQIVGQPEAVSMVFQEDRLLPWLTARENVCLPGADIAVAERYLAALGLSGEEQKTLPAHLSGGQQRRVTLARALANPGDLLLLDEPFNGLDASTWQSAVPLIVEQARVRPVVLVTHVREQAEALQATMLSLTGVPLTGNWT